MRATIAIAAFAAATVDASAIGARQGYKPLVDPKALQADIKVDGLRKGAQTLQDLAFKYPEKNRLMGSNGHNDTVKFLVKELEALDGYYKVETQKFSALVQTNGTGSLAINSVAEPSGLFEYSPSGNISAALVVVNNLGCEKSDYPAAVSGKIALISRGTCEFGLKSALAGSAGAIGAILYNNKPEPGPLEGTLGLPPRPEGEYIPTLGVNQTRGQELVAAIAGGSTITASLNVFTVIELYTTQNVIATSKGGAHNTTLALGAHTDSVAAGPGINDDGSGTIGILEVAKALSKYKTNNAVRFGFWSGEESGLLGSTYYVNSILNTTELSNTRAYLNFDMIASPNYVHAIYDGDGSAFNLTGPSGSAEIERFFENYFRSSGNNFTATQFDGRSDYQAFIDNGIPGGGTFTGAEELKTAEQALQFGGTAGQALDPNYHGAGDTVANLNFDAFLLHTKAIAAAVATYATSFESLPPKDLAKRNLAAIMGKEKRKTGNQRRGWKAMV